MITTSKSLPNDVFPDWCLRCKTNFQCFEDYNTHKCTAPQLDLGLAGHKDLPKAQTLDSYDPHPTTSLRFRKKKE